MDLTVIGAGPAYSRRPGGLGSAYLLSSGGRHLVLELGHGTFSGVASRVEPSELTAVVISHLHADHFIDLVALRHYLRWEFTPPRRIRVIGPTALGARLDALHGEPGFAAAGLDIEAPSPSMAGAGPFAIDGRRIRHTDESYAFRVTDGDGPGLVFSGDCGAAMDLAPLIRPGDTLLTEVSFGPGPAVPGAEHLDGPAVGALAAATRPGRVLLTHLLDGRDVAATIASVRAAYDGPVDLVTPGSAWAL